MPLLPDTFKCRTRAEPGQNDAFMLRCSFLDLECKILDWQACRLSKQSLSFVVSVWYPVSCHDHYTLTQRKGSINLPGSDMTRDPGRRNSERQDTSKRAAETVRRAASKTLDNFEIMLVLVQISQRDLSASRTWEFIKRQKLVSSLDNFPNRSLNSPTWFNPTGQILIPGYGKLKGPKPLDWRAVTLDCKPTTQVPSPWKQPGFVSSSTALAWPTSSSVSTLITTHCLSGWPGSFSNLSARFLRHGA